VSGGRTDRNDFDLHQQITPSRSSFTSRETSTAVLAGDARER